MMCSECIHNKMCEWVENPYEEIVCSDFLDAKSIIQLPCEIGTTFYGINGYGICQYTVNAIEYRGEGKFVFRTVYHMPFTYGEDAFLTKEEADRAIIRNAKAHYLNRNRERKNTK